MCDISPRESVSTSVRDYLRTSSVSDTRSDGAERQKHRAGIAFWVTVSLWERKASGWGARNTPVLCLYVTTWCPPKLLREVALRQWRKHCIHSVRCQAANTSHKTKSRTCTAAVVRKRSKWHTRTHTQRQLCSVITSTNLCKTASTTPVKYINN